MEKSSDDWKTQVVQRYNSLPALPRMPVQMPPDAPLDLDDNLERRRPPYSLWQPVQLCAVVLGLLSFIVPVAFDPSTIFETNAWWTLVTCNLATSNVLEFTVNMLAIVYVSD